MTRQNPTTWGNPRKIFFIKGENLRNFPTTQKNYSSEPYKKKFQNHINNKIPRKRCQQYSTACCTFTHAGTVCTNLSHVWLYGCTFCTFCCLEIRATVNNKWCTACQSSSVLSASGNVPTRGCTNFFRL